MDWFEWAALLAFGLLSLWIVALDLWQVIAHGRVWTGTDGIYIVDQMQYLAWIRDASHHLLASNLFVLRDTPSDYFQPAIVLSGALVALGVVPWVALLVWKPVAVLVVFWGVRAYVRRSVSGTGPRRAALVLALFFGSFSVVYGSWGVVGDLLLSFLSWGYTFGLVALGTMLLALLAYERTRSAAQPVAARRLAAPALLGAATSLLHPWQGELLILILIGGEGWIWLATRRRPLSLRLAVLTLAGAGLPLFYYLILGRADPSWHMARIASKHTFSLLTILLAIAPLALVALPAYRGHPRSFLDATARFWPLAALIIYAFSASDVSATPLHAFQGVTVPLAVLAVQGSRRMGLARLRGAPALATVAVTLATVPAIAFELRASSRVVRPSHGNPNFISRDEHQALEYLARNRVPGGVLTRFYLGVVVPGETGRRTFVGDCLWSQPHCVRRAQIAQMVFDGSLPARVARSFVLDSGARFVLADCHTRPDMDHVMAPITASSRRFGCAAVYELAPEPSRAGPLAQSAPDAALRASGRQQRGVQSG